MLESSPEVEFGLEHLVPSCLGEQSIPQSGISPLGRLTAAVNTESEGNDLTPKSRTKRWVQLPRRDEDSEKVQWWSDESGHSDHGRAQKVHRRASSSVSNPGTHDRPLRSHKSHESNRTLDQQSFWNTLRGQRSLNMSSLYESRWAATPPAEEHVGTTPNKAESSLFASRWAATPPAELSEEDDEGEERLGDVQEPLTKDLNEEKEGPQSTFEKTGEVKSTLEEREGELPAQHDVEPLQDGEDHATEGRVYLPENKIVENPLGNSAEQPVLELPQDEPVKAANAPGEAEYVAPLSPVKSRLEPRLKKKVSWRGKNCIISIPKLNYDTLGFVKPMSSDEIETRLMEFEKAGYNTHGFDLSLEDSGDNPAVHVKPIYPHESDLRASASEEGANVRLPDLNKWSAYMDWLTEQKLAALGVSIGSEEPAPVPAPTQEMSRQSSGQYPPLPFSPPLPNTSAASMSRPTMVRGHSHTMSVASPISPLNGPFGHMHRHSTFSGPLGFAPAQQQLPQQSSIPSMHAFSPQPQQHMQQPLMPGMQSFSPQKQFGMPRFDRAGSPAQLAAMRNGHGAAHGSDSPLSQQMLPQSHQDYSRGLADDQFRRRQHTYSQSMALPPMPMPNSLKPLAQNPQSTPVLPELPEEDDEEDLLERSEAEPEEQRTLEPEAESEPGTPAYVPPHKRAQFNANIAVPTPRGHSHNISEGFEREILEKEQRSEAEKNNWVEVDEDSDPYADQARSSKPKQKELLSKSAAERDPLSQDDVVEETAHHHKKSASRFNVSAPAFIFNPGASFQPASTAFTFGASQPKTNGHPSFGHNRQQSSGAFNVTAPAFTPAGSHPLATKSEFSFSASGLSFKPDAPSFEPSKPQQTTIIDELQGIFSKVKIPDIPKPARRSKAVEIRRPEDVRRSLGGSVTEFEDENGRPLQSEDRFKRQRKFGDDGDEVPRFAEPTLESATMSQPVDFVMKSQQDDFVEVHFPAVDDVEAATSEALEEVAAKDIETAEELVGYSDSNLYQPKEADMQRQRPSHQLSGSLSALANPFEPPVLLRSDSASIDKPHESFASISELEEGEVEDEENPTISPLREPRIGSEEQSRSVRPMSEAPQSFQDSASARIDNFTHGEPSFDEIDAVMRQLNDAEGHTRDGANISPLPSSGAHPMEGVTYLPEWSRSDAPSPSPRRHPATFNSQPDSSFTAHERTETPEPAMNGWPHINRLNKAEDHPTSDWSGFLSSPDEEKLNQRSNFFDSHIDNLIDRVLERRLQPLEESLRSMQGTANKRPISQDQLQKQRSSSAIESDADDEDELSEEHCHRPISRGRDKRMDHIKSVVLEALREQSSHRSPQSSYDLQDIHSVLADMKISFARAASASLELDDIRAVVNDIVSKQSQAVVPVATDSSDRTIAHNREMSELEGRFNETLAGALEEANLRRTAEERETETKRMLRLAEEELQLLRDTSRDDDSRIQAAEHQREDLFDRLERAENANREMEEQVKNLEAEHAASHATLEEYRMSSHKWRQDIDQATRERETLEKSIVDLKREVEQSQESSGSMKRRLEKLHFEMAAAAGQLASEKADWKNKEEDYRTRCESLEAQQLAHIKERSHLEDELRALRTEATKAPGSISFVDQMKTSNSDLNDMIRKLQTDLIEQQSLAARFEREFHDARDASRAEVQRTRMSMETDIEAANHQVNIVRADLESELSRVRSEFENVKIEAETAKARHEHVLEEEETSRRETLRKLNHTNSVALEEARQKHDASLQELQQAHSWALEYSVEDKQRSEHFLNERLALSDAKLQHFQDRVLHLEERLEVTKSAAQAAVMNVQQSKATPTVPSAVASVPEKISPQALRESILVLQEQLQERESHIDKLQNEVDMEAPAKLKLREDEIAWLRELLAVRSEELTDLVNTLAQPTFDRAAVRDTAIRIRANLSMEQQEKERFGQNSQSLPGQAIASLSNFATPKAVQLTSAFNKWRSTMENSALKTAPRASGRPTSATPSKPAASSSIPPGYKSGLMTPPASNLRNTPSPEATGSLPAPRLQSRSGSKPTVLPLSEPPKPANRRTSAVSEAPTTPLFHSQNYDCDAEDNQAHMESFEDEDLDIADNQPPAFRSLELELEDATTPMESEA